VQRAVGVQTKHWRSFMFSFASNAFDLKGSLHYVSGALE